jgi:CRP-like cAMP-binding protein
MHTADPSPGAHPLLAKIERSIVLTAPERAVLHDLPYMVEKVKVGDGPIWAGDRPTRSFLVLEGLLSTSKAIRDGELQITAFHIPGDMPDLQSLHLEVLDSDIGALTNCTLAFTSHSDLRRLCAEHPRLAAVLWRVTLVDASVTREWVVNVGQRQALSRLAHLFCELMTRMEAVGLVHDGGCYLGLTQTDLREATGLSSVHIHRTLQELRERSLLTFGQGRLTILDWAALARLGDFRTDYLHQHAPDSPMARGTN